MNTLASIYDPKNVEKKWYEFWENSGCFHAEPAADKEPFTIVIPPPNVTGQLHLGHALNNTLQDILIRRKRMQGFSALWMPGTDHAGIATQAKVEEVLQAEQGLSRHDLGRELFLEKVWQWKEQYGSRIIEQLKTMGCSCDWERERFTMDDGCSKAVREVFVTLYEKGLIYRGKRITNWCPRCMTALSDIEVEHTDTDGKLHYVRYVFADDSENGLTVATTRPETILGDTAVAVNPDDIRYKKAVGRKLLVPGTDRAVPVIADSYVDKEFGTGAVKITPAHDPNDFEMGQRHNLGNIVVIEKDGTMSASAGKYAGMDRYDCRRSLLADLELSGNLVKIEEHPHAVGHCSRCNNTIEPLISEQWYVKMAPLAKPAADAVRDGRITFIPERFAKIYLHWMDNIRDWCISRQLWWGHRIPAWYCCECKEISVSRYNLEKCPVCGGKVIQDEDVLDTWFSSALWPFSTMGWPDKTETLKYYYPTSVLVTGYDIIPFWVARMIFCGLEFMNDIPFSHVFITGLVRDSQGRKMSKSLGNGIDPLDVIENYGADALRFALVSGNTPGNDMRFYIEKVETYRNFANKIWNASRFVLMNTAEYDYNSSVAPENTALADKWILSRLQNVTSEISHALDNYQPGEAARMIYEFIWDEFCDWYIEFAKCRLYDKSNSAAADIVKWVLLHVLEQTMRLLHPFMPFITEEIWQKLPGRANCDSIMLAAWPDINQDYIDQSAEHDMNFVMECIRAIRNLRAEVNAQPGRKSEAVIIADNYGRDILEGQLAALNNMAAASPVTFSARGEEKYADALTAVCGDTEIMLPLKGLIDIDKETGRLSKELEQLDKEVHRLEKKLANSSFLDKAPTEVVEKERIKLNDYLVRRKKIDERVKYLHAL